MQQKLRQEIIILPCVVFFLVFPMMLCRLILGLKFALALRGCASLKPALMYLGLK